MLPVLLKLWALCCDGCLKLMCRTHYSQGAMCCTHSTDSDYSQGAFSSQERCVSICTFETVPLASVFELRHTLSLSLSLSRCFSLSLPGCMQATLIPPLPRSLSHSLTQSTLISPLSLIFIIRWAMPLELSRPSDLT